MQDFENTFSDAETLGKVLGFAFVGAIVATMPTLVIGLALVLSAILFFVAFTHVLTFECEFECTTPKADLEFVAHVQRVLARQHSAKTSFAMRRAKRIKTAIVAFENRSFENQLAFN